MRKVRPQSGCREEGNVSAEGKRVFMSSATSSLGCRQHTGHIVQSVLSLLPCLLWLRPPLPHPPFVANTALFICSLVHTVSLKMVCETSPTTLVLIAVKEPWHSSCVT